MINQLQHRVTENSGVLDLSFIPHLIKTMSISSYIRKVFAARTVLLAHASPREKTIRLLPRPYRRDHQTSYRRHKPTRIKELRMEVGEKPITAGPTRIHA